MFKVHRDLWLTEMAISCVVSEMNMTLVKPYSITRPHQSKGKHKQLKKTPGDITDKTFMCT